MNAYDKWSQSWMRIRDNHVMPTLDDLPSPEDVWNGALDSATEEPRKLDSGSPSPEGSIADNRAQECIRAVEELKCR